MIDYKKIREGKHCCIWTRVSTKHQEDNGGSLETQMEICKEYAERCGYTYQEQIDSYGGKHESAKTPGKMVTEMISRVKKDKTISTILVSEFDRLSRCNWQASKILDDLRTLGIIVIAAKVGLDTRTKEGMLMAKNSIAMAEWDNQNRVDKFVGGKDGCMKSGAYVLKAPRWYYKEGKSRETWCFLNRDGKLLKKAFEWKLQGYSNGEILSKLSALGLDIEKQELHKILVNPLYAGKIKGKHTNDELVDGHIEPAVSYENFLKVQKIMSSRTGKYTHSKHKPDVPLTKHVRCAVDGTPFTSYTKTKKTKNTCHHYDYYKCNKAGCKTNVSAKELHEKYEQLLAQYELPASLIERFVSIIHVLLADYEADIKVNVTILKRRLSEVEASIKKTRIRFAEGKIDEETFQTAIAEFQYRKDQITLELGQRNENLSNLDKQIPTIVSTASHISDLWHNAGLETKRRIQNLVFPDGILWDKEKRDYRTLSRNKFFDVLDKFSITYGGKKGTAPDGTVPLCG